MKKQAVVALEKRRSKARTAAENLQTGPTTRVLFQNRDLRRIAKFDLRQAVISLGAAAIFLELADESQASAGSWAETGRAVPCASDNAKHEL